MVAILKAHARNSFYEAAKQPQKDPMDLRKLVPGRIAESTVAEAISYADTCTGGSFAIGPLLLGDAARSPCSRVPHDGGAPVHVSGHTESLRQPWILHANRERVFADPLDLCAAALRLRKNELLRVRFQYGDHLFVLLSRHRAEDDPHASGMKLLEKMPPAPSLRPHWRPFKRNRPILSRRPGHVAV